jgi:hypothetical protein
VDWEVVDTLDPDIVQWEVVDPSDCGLSGGDCPSNFACWFGTESTQCFPSLGKPRGADCDPAQEVLDCADGLYCVGEPGLAACEPLCVSDTDCAGTEHCLGPLLAEGSFVGLCVCDDADDDGTCDDQQDLVTQDAASDLQDPDSAGDQWTPDGQAPEIFVDAPSLDFQTPLDDVMDSKPKSSSGGCGVSAHAAESNILAILALLLAGLLGRQRRA